MSIFKSESEMQSWLSTALSRVDGLGELLTPGSREPSVLAAATEGEKAIVNSYVKCLDSLLINEVICENQNISISEGEVLKPDFLLYAPENESLVFVELKNIAGPTREAGTELGAYLGEMRTAIPFISGSDVIHVIISNNWPVLLRHYVFHEIFWHRRSIACLRPEQIEDAVGLAWVSPTELAAGSLAPTISSRHLGGFQICLYDDELQRGSADRHRLDEYVEPMKTALQIMAATGNSQNGHGFAFLWRDLWDKSLAPYSVTVLNFSPFQTIERFLHLNLQSPPFLVARLIRLVQDHDPEGHGAAISELSDRCAEVVEHFCSPRPEGYTDWGNLKEIMSPRADYIGFSAWGLFQDSFANALTARYKAGDLTTRYDCPLLGMEVVNSLIDENYPFIELHYLDDDEGDDEDDDEGDDEDYK